MGIYMLIIAVLTATNPPNASQGLTPTAIASITMIYLEAMSYNISWGPVPWVGQTPPEISVTSINAKRLLGIHERDLPIAHP